MLLRTNFVIAPGSYDIVVGAGAPAITSNPSTPIGAGESTSAFGVVATGGGYGGSEIGDSSINAGGPGGNSGGGNYGFGPGTATAPVAPGWSVFGGNAGASGGDFSGTYPCGGGKLLRLGCVRNTHIYIYTHTTHSSDAGGGAGGPAPALTNPNTGPGGAGGPGVQINGMLGGNFFWGGGGGGTAYAGVCLCVCVYVSVCLCVHVCVHVCLCLCLCLCARSSFFFCYPCSY